MQNMGFKFRFKLQSRFGPMIDGVMINALDEAEAARKLYQVYPACRIIETKIVKIISNQLKDGFSVYKSAKRNLEINCSSKISNMQRSIGKFPPQQSANVIKNNSEVNYELEEIIDLISN